MGGIENVRKKSEGGEGTVVTGRKFASQCNTKNKKHSWKKKAASRVDDKSGRGDER